MNYAVLLRNYKLLWIQIFLTQESQYYRAIRLKVFTTNIRIHPEKVRVKQSLYKPVQSHTGSGSQISKGSANESGKFFSPTHRPPFPTRKYSWYSFLLQAESPLGYSAAGRIMSMKNSIDSIRNRTRDLVAHCLNQLRHRVHPDPYSQILHKPGPLAGEACGLV